MTINLVPENKEAGFLEMPNGFWPAFCVEVPGIAKIMGCKYLDPERLRIYYEHDGYVGELIDKETALKMNEVLIEFAKTSECDNHRYFGSRRNQIDYALDFLPCCDGFKLGH